MQTILYRSANGADDDGYVEFSWVLPFMRNFESKCVFLLFGDIHHFIEATGILRNECTLLKIWHNVVEVMFGCKVFDIFHENIPWDVRERIGDPGSSC